MKEPLRRAPFPSPAQCGALRWSAIRRALLPQLHKYVISVRQMMARYDQTSAQGH
jgi:hypothetical protein